MTQQKRNRVAELAAFVAGAGIDALSPRVRDRAAISVLDSIACGIGGLSGEPVRRIADYVRETGGAPAATLLGGGRTSADRAALFNGAAIRYLDYNDTFAATGESCHPSDNVAPVLAVAEASGCSGADFVLALVLAYEVQCRLSEAAPVRARGFDHTVLGMLGMAAGAARARSLSVEQTAHALAITGTAFNALRVTRTGSLSHWKGLAAPNAALCAVHAVGLAAHGITGPEQVFEGNKGIIDTITGPFTVDWHAGGIDRILRCSIKKHNAEFHAQSAIEAALTVRRDARFNAESVERIDVTTFATGFHIIGGGEEGEKTTIRTREDADHSLPYMLAVALLDGEVGPGQYAPERISRSDANQLLRRVHVAPDPAFSRRFPEEMPARVRVTLADGTVIGAETRGYHGFWNDPFTWDDACEKFDRLTAGIVPPGLRDELVQAVRGLERLESIETLTGLLGRVPQPER